MPNTGSIALIQSGGTGSNLFLRETTSGTVDAGTIIFSHSSYRNILAGTGTAAINFGTSAGLDIILPGENAFIGDASGSAPKVAMNLPSGGHLSVRIEGLMGAAVS